MAVLLSLAPDTDSRLDAKSIPSTHYPNESEGPRFRRYILNPHTIPQSLFYALIITIPLAINTPVFIPSILAVRLLLFAPLFLPSARTPSYKSAMVVVVPFLASCTAFIMENGPEALLQGIKEVPGSWYGASPAAMKTVLSAVNDNHAVQALGWDAVICVGSGLIWSLAA